MLLINDQNYAEHVGDGRQVFAGGEYRLLQGCQPRESRYGSLAWAPAAASQLPVIPRSDWAARIQQAEAERSMIKHLIADLDPLDQNGKNSCASNSVTFALMAARRRMGEPDVLLSPGSIYGPITGGANVGTSLDDNCQQVATVGIASQSIVPPNAINPRTFPSQWQNDAASHKLTLWFDVGSIEEQITCAILGLPVAGGLSWWSHAVCQIGASVLSDGTIVVDMINSWGKSYGDNGRFQLSLNRGTYDMGAFAPAAATPSAV
jgi:hypothetical protein